MAKRKPYVIVYAPAIKAHLRAIDAKDHSLIQAKVVEQLQFEPAVETTNRKLLRQPAPFDATWEIRLGPDNRYRVLYDIDEEAHEVLILAVGEKRGSRLWVEHEEV
jgi:mRNA-degrading endonuclease RelE of RelBE toxin-antitoxin system